MKEKILLDTDIGTEVDDAITIAYLLANPDAELAGITTVTGESVLRARLASAVCLNAGKHIPVVAGCEQPMVLPQIEKYAPQAKVLDRWPHEDSFEPNQAVSFLQKTIRANPGRITLLGIAPMTNIGLLFAVDPEIPSLLKRLIVMCGSPTATRYDGQSEKMSAMEKDDRMILAGRGVRKQRAARSHANRIDMMTVCCICRWA